MVAVLEVIRHCDHKRVYGLLLARSIQIMIRESDTYAGLPVKLHWCPFCRGWFLSPRGRLKILAVNALTALRA